MSEWLEGQKRLELNTMRGAQIQAAIAFIREHVAGITHTRLRKAWVTKTRPGLPNHALAELCYRNLELVGPPVWDVEALRFCREMQRNLGLEPMEQPIMDKMRVFMEGV